MAKFYRYVKTGTEESATYVNPERRMEKELIKSHGLTSRKQLKKLLKERRRNTNATESDTI